MLGITIEMLHKLTDEQLRIVLLFITSLLNAPD
jgi:hypothetical protein